MSYATAGTSATSQTETDEYAITPTNVRRWSTAHIRGVRHAIRCRAAVHFLREEMAAYRYLVECVLTLQTELDRRGMGS